MILMEIALCAGFALVLDMLPSIRIGFISISFAMVPIFILAFRLGSGPSAISGLLWGLLQILTGDAADDIKTPLQAIIEFFIAFTFIGFAGFFRPLVQSNVKKKRNGKTIFWITIAILVGSLGRYFWHFLAGFIFWGEYAPKGQSAVFYSLVVNGTSFLGSFILCTVVLSVLLTTSPRLIKKIA